MEDKANKVLLIEDNPGDARLIWEMLAEVRGAPFDLELADRLSTGLERIAEREFEVVLLDLNLPDSRGLGTLAKLTAQVPQVPIVVLSGLADDLTTIEAIRQGSQDYLVKGDASGPMLARVLRYAIERKRAEEALRRRDGILEAIAFAAEQFLRTPNWEESIAAVLARLGEATGVSRVYVFENHADLEGVLLTSQRYEWVAPGITPQIDNPDLQDFPWHAGGFTRWVEAMEQGGLIHGHVREFPEGECQVLAAQDIQSIVTVPVFVEQKWWGFIGFDECLKEREWSAVERDALRAAGDTLGAAIQRKLAEEQIQRQLQRLSALRDVDMAITASLDLRVTLNVILDQVTSQLGVDATNVLLFNPHTRTLEYAASRGFRSGALQHTHLRLGEGYAGRAALERRMVSVPHIAEAEDGLRRSPLLPSEEFIAYRAVPLIAKGQIKGVLEIFHRAPLEPDPEWLDFLQTLAGQTAIAIDNTELFDGLQRSNLELTMAYDTTLEGWAKALELRDMETEGHTRRVTEMTLRLARALGMNDDELVHVRRGALLHDIGKMGMPDSILLKPDKLTEEEWEIMRQHPVYAHELLAPIRHLRPALDIPYCHHEKWDGSGYPRGLKGEMIPLPVRVFAVVDVWDALTSERPYRAAWPRDEALAYIKEQAGKHFDPRVVEMFLRMVSEMPQP